MNRSLIRGAAKLRAFNGLKSFPLREVPAFSRLAGWLVCGCLVTSLAGCASLVSSAASSLAVSLQSAIVGSDDPETVRAAIPAYLILLDGFVSDAPDDADLLLAAAQLNGAYSGVFVDDPERARRMADKALRYAERGVCAASRRFCNVRELPYDAFETWAAKLGQRDVAAAYALASTWAGWLQANSDDWNAIGELAKVKALMGRVAELDPGYDHGGPELYLGVFETLLPPSMGGKPELGREHFERAIELSGGQQLLAKVYFAERYARLVFDRELHDRLLREVLDTEVDVPDLRLINSVARLKAAQLLASADDYF